MNDRDLDKKIFRHNCLKKLKKSSQKSKLNKNMRIIANLEYIIKLSNPKTILLYLPLNIEPDLRKLITKLKKSSTVLVPFMQNISFKIVKYRLPLHKKKFNIYEPPNSFFTCKRVDLAIVPVVGVDGHFKRIGFGKGMYDRFFSKLKYRPITVFVQIEECYTNIVLSNTYDIDADYFVTPKKIMKKRERNDRINFRRGCRIINRNGRFSSRKKI